MQMLAEALILAIPTMPESFNLLVQNAAGGFYKHVLTAWICVWLIDMCCTCK
jgi:hypothetical protein